MHDLPDPTIIISALGGLIAGQISYWCGYYVGRRGQQRAFKRRELATPKYMCSCGEALGQHKKEADGELAPCNGEKVIRISWNEESSWGTTEQRYEDQIRPCTCQNYDGPIPLPEYIPREII